MLRITSKKGLTASFIVGMMITIIAFVLISGVLIRFMSESEGKEAEILCHDSIALRAQSVVQIEHGLANVEIKGVPVLCETSDKKIEGTREDIKRQIADSMARCWWMFGEGRYPEILEGSDIDLLPSLLGTEELQNQCFNCYTLLIDEAEIQGGPIPSTEMGDFLANEIYAPRNVTYLQYIQEFGGPGVAGILSGTIQAREAYTISIMPVVKEEGSTNWVKWIGVGVVGGIGLVCTVTTAGLCGAPAVAAVSGAAGTAAAGALTYELVDGRYADDPGFFANYANGIPLEELFREREVSSVYLANLQLGQQMCGSGDISGR